MKYFQSYEDYLNLSLNESKFWDWLLRAGKAKRYGISIANARYNLHKRELEMKNLHLDEGDDADAFTPDEIAELKTYEDEAINMENQLETWIVKNGGSEYLRHVSKQAELEQENANIKKLRTMAHDKKDKSKYDKIEQNNKQQVVLIKQDNKEYETIVKRNKAKARSASFDPESYRDKRKAMQRQEKMTNLELQKANLQKKDLENRVKISQARGETEDYKRLDYQRRVSSSGADEYSTANQEREESPKYPEYREED